jgi:PAS domain S-box-containing protein
MSREFSTDRGTTPSGRLTAEHVAARALLSARTIDEAAPKILEAICDSLGWLHGALWTIDRQAGLLRCAHIWNRPGADLPEFDAISRVTTFAPGVGLPGRVWQTGRPVWIPDVTLDSNFPRAQIATRENLHAAFGFPILLRGEVQSVLEFFSPEILEPDDALLSMLTTVGNEIGMFIERRRAEEELDRFFTLSLDMLAVAGFDGYFKRVNPVWERVLGWTEHELLTKPYMDFVHPDDVAPTIEAASRLGRGSAIVQFENRYFHKDGTTRWLLWTSAPFPEHQVVYAVAHDITDRKVTERMLEDQAVRLTQLVHELEIARRRAEEATETKSAFLANMSHEIRTPLNAILGMASLALNTRLSPRQRDYLETVKASGEALLLVVNDVLDFSKIDARRLELERTAFDVRDVVGDAARLLCLRAAEKRIELACDINARTPTVLLGDPGRFRQVLLNILGNAVKFTDKGEVVVRVRPDEGASDDERAVLVVSVSDTGIGIPAEKRDHVFQAFTQADSSTTRRFGGTGLGLAISQRLVELMGGRIWVESNVGVGSTFHFTAVFDRPSAEASVPVAREREPKALVGLRVLVVDDNATNLRILREMLESWQMQPVVAADAAAGLRELEDATAAGRPYDVVVTDAQMPDMDGFMFARRIKQDRRLHGIPVVMLTSMGRPDDSGKSRAAGVHTYLTKPVKHSDLLDAFTAIFGGLARQSPAPPAAVEETPGPRKPLRVLIAEDNAVNRKLVTTLLRKRRHLVKAVENGRAALDAVSTGGWDVVLMDLQMPEMGGLEATRSIRAAERTTGRHVPIVALTAHAMPGDRDRCLDAGMDDYLAKPIDVPLLIAVVERLGRQARGAAANTVPGPGAAAPGDGPLLDEAAALTYAGGDRRLLRQVVGLFRSDATVRVRAMGRAIRARDAEALRVAAHTLKGAAGAVGAGSSRALASSLEQMGRAGELQGAAPALEELRQVLGELDAAFFRAGLATPRRRKRPKPARRTRRRRRA